MLRTLSNTEITVKGWKQTESIYIEMDKTGLEEKYENGSWKKIKLLGSYVHKKEQ